MSFVVIAEPDEIHAASIRAILDGVDCDIGRAENQRDRELYQRVQSVQNHYQAVPARGRSAGAD